MKSATAMAMRDMDFVSSPVRLKKDRQESETGGPKPGACFSAGVY